MRDILIIKCGNAICRRKYMDDVYGVNETNFRQYMDENYCMELLKRKGINGSKFIWKICKGCRSTYFCSRKCQKIARVMFDHRQQCKTVQNIRSELFNE